MVAASWGARAPGPVAGGGEALPLTCHGVVGSDAAGAVSLIQQGCGPPASHSCLGPAEMSSCLLPRVPFSALPLHGCLSAGPRAAPV